MHPGLVAGAWVGFNDQRVTMRSSWWGQGGHNAILLVGDFFRSVLKDKLIDAKARFPQPRRPLPVEEPLPAEASLQVDPGWADVSVQPAMLAALPAPAPGPSTIAGSEPPKPAYELERVVSAIERSQTPRSTLPQLLRLPVVQAPASAASASISAGRQPVSISDAAEEALAAPVEEQGAETLR
jgi:penicillin-binding protein 1A